jgi:release factor glutamine methyltransferase
MAVNLLTIKDIRLYLEKELGNLYNENEIASLSRIIIKTIIKPRGLHQVYNPDFRLNHEQSSIIPGITEELKTGKPWQYVLSETEFYNCIIKVTPSVLIPRPETEELTDIIIRENRDFKGDILDFGTGSGCIAIALALNIPGARVTGFDISEAALLVAEENARINNVRATFEKNDIFNFTTPTGRKAGIIVSNPPYVRKSEKMHMKRNVLDFEPPIALFVEDSDPLRFYRTILDISEDILLPGGRIYFEINEALHNEIMEMLSTFNFSKIGIIKDLNGRYRFAKGEWNG